ncbi:MAG: hypothetical protein R3338_06810, partial [Thermoanaerobaculia bacterium]|nr:hypothetical protein [Thermoanaerobaculia bacterium]
EYTAKDSLALRQTFQSLVSVRWASLPPQEELMDHISRLRELKSEIEKTAKFEDFTDRNLVGRLRELKHDLGIGLFHPDVLLAIVQTNITMKNQTRKLYAEEEEIILKNAKRLLENERNLKQGFAASDPSASAELERFKEFKQKFDESRKTSNLKFDELSKLKKSMQTLLVDLESEEGPTIEEDVEPAIEKANLDDQIEEIFGDDPMVHRELVQIAEALAPWADRVGVAERLSDDVVGRLRMEKWEAEAWFRLIHGEDEDPSLKERDQLFMRGAALRQKISDVARDLVAGIERSEVGESFLLRIKSVLTAAERMDAHFGALIQGVEAGWSPRDMMRLHRSSIRLFREFSGLWLLYDQYLEENPQGRSR